MVKKHVLVGFSRWLPQLWHMCKLTFPTELEPVLLATFILHYKKIWDFWKWRKIPGVTWKAVTSAHPLIVKSTDSAVDTAIMEVCLLTGVITPHFITVVRTVTSLITLVFYGYTEITVQNISPVPTAKLVCFAFCCCCAVFLSSEKYRNYLQKAVDLLMTFLFYFENKLLGVFKQGT